MIFIYNDDYKIMLDDGTTYENIMDIPILEIKVESKETLAGYPKTYTRDEIIGKLEDEPLLSDID